MFEAALERLNVILSGDGLRTAKEAYSIAITYFCFNEGEFSHLQPRDLSNQLAQNVIRSAGHGRQDSKIISEEALSALRPLSLPSNL